MEIKPPKIRRISAAYQERISFRAVCEALSIRIDGDDSKAMKYLGFKKNECVYCGKKVNDQSELTWDHLIPITPPPLKKKNESFVEISEIGHSVYGNLVRACSSCNSSKGNKEFQAWMKSGTPKAPDPKVAAKRIPKLECYQDLMKCSPEFEMKRNKLEKYRKLSYPR